MPATFEFLPSKGTCSVALAYNDLFASTTIPWLQISAEKFASKSEPYRRGCINAVHMMHDLRESGLAVAAFIACEECQSNEADPQQCTFLAKEYQATQRFTTARCARCVFFNKTCRGGQGTKLVASNITTPEDPAISPAVSQPSFVSILKPTSGANQLNGGEDLEANVIVAHTGKLPGGYAPGRQEKVMEESAALEQHFSSKEETARKPFEGPIASRLRYLAMSLNDLADFCDRHPHSDSANTKLWLDALEAKILEDF